jgi:hypothetical protein
MSKHETKTAKAPREDTDAPLPLYYQYKGDGPPPAYWYAPDGTKVFRSYADYCANTDDRD